MTSSPDESSRYSSSAEGDGFNTSMDDDKIVREQQVTTPPPILKEDETFSTSSSLLDNNLPIETGASCKFSDLL